MGAICGDPEPLVGMYRWDWWHWGSAQGQPLTATSPFSPQKLLVPSQPSVPMLGVPMSPRLSPTSVTSSRQGFFPTETLGLGHLHTPHMTLCVPSLPEQ